MLGLPPAFVLSQDQTLKLKSCYQLILDVRTSAHICPDRQRPGRSVCCASGFHQKTESRPNSEADTGHRFGSDPRLPARHICAVVDPSNEPNRPHISSDIHQFQRAWVRKPRDKINRLRLNFLARPASSASIFCAGRPSEAALRHSVWRSVERLSAAGEGVFTVWAGPPQPLFSANAIFFSKFRFFPKK